MLVAAPHRPEAMLWGSRSITRATPAGAAARLQKPANFRPKIVRRSSSSRVGSWETVWRQAWLSWQLCWLVTGTKWRECEWVQKLQDLKEKHIFPLLLAPLKKCRFDPAKFNSTQLPVSVLRTIILENNNVPLTPVHKFLLTPSTWTEKNWHMCLQSQPQEFPPTRQISYLKFHNPWQTFETTPFSAQKLQERVHKFCFWLESD